MSIEPIHGCPTLRTRAETLAARASKFPGVDVTAVQSGVTLLQLSSALFGAFDLHYTRHGISRGRFIVLIFLEEQPDGLSPAELAERGNVTRATMTGLVDTLEQGGMVERHDDPGDRRMYRVRITDKGRAFLQEMLPEHFRRMAALMAHLSHEDRLKLMELLQKIERGIDAVRIE
jgi:DNA-binding MarR family transcriptional regulator